MQIDGPTRTHPQNYVVANLQSYHELVVKLQKSLCNVEGGIYYRFGLKYSVKNVKAIWFKKLMHNACHNNNKYTIKSFFLCRSSN